MIAKQLGSFISYNLLEAFRRTLRSPWSLEGDVHEGRVKETRQGRMMTHNQIEAVVGRLGKESMQGVLDSTPPNEQNKAVCGVPQSYAHT